MTLALSGKRPRRKFVLVAAGLLAVVAAVVVAVAAQTAAPASADTASGYAGSTAQTTDQAWVNPDNALGAPDGASATRPAEVGSLVLNEFDITIPAGATVNDIELTATAATNTPGAANECSLEVRVSWLGSGFANDDWTPWVLFPAFGTTLAEHSQDGSSLGAGVWGRSWTSEEVGGIRVQVRGAGDATSGPCVSAAHYSLDAIHVAVDYAPPMHELAVCKIFQRADGSLYRSAAPDNVDDFPEDDFSIQVQGPEGYDETLSIPQLPYIGTISVSPHSLVHRDCVSEELPEGTYTYGDEIGADNADWEPARFHEAAAEELTVLADYCEHDSGPAICDGEIELTEDSRIYILNRVAEQETPTPTAEPTGTPTNTPEATVSPTSTPSATATPDGETHAYTLHFRWSLLGWVSPDMPIEAAVRGEGLNAGGTSVFEQVTAIFAWDNATQSWLAYFPGFEDVPQANDLEMFEQARAYWVAIEGPDTITWEVANSPD